MAVDAKLRVPLPRAFVRAVQCRFDVQGYLVIPSALSESEVAALRSATQRLDLPERGDYRPLLGSGAEFLELLDHPRVFPCVLALMGGAIQVASSCATVIPPGAGPMVWHEDGPRPWSYPDVGGRRPLTMLRLGVYLDDLSSGQRGQLTVVPGSHHVAFHRAGAENAGRQPGAMPVNVTAGSAVLFHNALWHSTAPNTMPTPRTALYFAYTPLWHRTLDYAAPPAELLRDVEAFPKGRRELLRQLVGATPEGAGPQSHFFPTVEQFPGLGLVEPEHPASGA